MPIGARGAAPSPFAAVGAGFGIVGADMAVGREVERLADAFEAEGVGGIAGLSADEHRVSDGNSATAPDAAIA